MRPLFAFAFSVLFVAPAVAADAVAELLRLAPKDTTVALAIRDLRGHVKRLDESPFAAWFPASKLGKSLLASGQWKTLEATEKLLAEQLGTTGDAVVNDLLGDAVVFAYRGGDDSGLILLKAGKPALLAKLIDKLNAAQKAGGEVKEVREKKHGAATYFERDRGAGRSEFYWVSGGTVAFSQTEATVREAIDRAATPAPAPLADALDKLKLTTAAVVGVFHPRSLDAELKAAVADAKDASQKAFLTQFQRLWAACDAVAVSVELGTSLDVALNVAVNPKAVPDELKPLLTPGTASALWSAIPADALLAVAGNLDAPKLLDALRPFLADDGKAGLKVLLDDRIGPIVGKNKVPAILAGIGPDVAFWVTAPATGATGWAPVATFALKVGEPGAKDGLGPVLLSALDALALLLRIEYNRHHDDQIELKTDATPDGDVKSLANDAFFPPGIRPAFGLRHGYLVASTSDAAVKAFTAPTAPPAAATGLVARVSLARLRQYLTDHEADVVPAVAKLTGAKPAELKSQFANFGDVLELFDSVELRRAGAGGLIRLSLTVKPAKPLAK